ncbi:MAG: hypothetical protein FP816_21420 [Desulfobacteraceae bacterium]|nr:hypothetical protein [Desulfobacteraceae bacterium]
MKEKHFRKWEKIRSDGRSSFIWRKGVLQWGITISIFWSILMQIIQPQKPIWIRPLVAIILFPIGGYIWGLFVWKSTEKKYQQHIETNLS